MERTIQWLNFLPLAFFMWGPRLFLRVPLIDSWSQPFYWGTAIAGMQVLYSLYSNMPLDYVALGANLFFVYGALGCIFSSGILIPYFLLRQSGMFLFIFLWGLGVTLFRQEGFLQVPAAFYSSSLEGSCGLLGITCLAFGLSYLLVTYTKILPSLSIGLPLIVLLIGRTLFYEYITQKKMTL